MSRGEKNKVLLLILSSLPSLHRLSYCFDRPFMRIGGTISDVGPEFIAFAVPLSVTMPLELAIHSDCCSARNHLSHFATLNCRVRAEGNRTILLE